MVSLSEALQNPDLVHALTPRWTKYIPHAPHPKQHAFLLLEHTEALYGGAAGGGKSDALLMAALQYVDVPGYSALLLRRTNPQLVQPGGLIPRSKEWLWGTDAVWAEMKKQWTFPSGAVLAFGTLQYDDTVHEYQGSDYQFIGFDELTHFTAWQYRYMFSRLRKLSKSPVPLRMRAGSNPGGIGHDWVKKWFVDDRNTGRIFVPARLADNPSLNQQEYRTSLSHLDPITREQLLNGDWTARHGGGKFRREWFAFVPEVPAQARYVRYWDLASTPATESTDPDWTVGAKLGVFQGIYYLADVKRMRGTPRDVEQMIAAAAQRDGLSTAIYMEQEPGASGVAVIDHYARTVLQGYAFRGVKTTGDKVMRADPVSSAAEARNIKILTAPWNNDFIDELEAFPVVAHDDQVDALSGAFQALANRTPLEQAIRI